MVEREMRHQKHGASKTPVASQPVSPLCTEAQVEHLIVHLGN